MTAETDSTDVQQSCPIDPNCKICFYDRVAPYSCGRDGLRVIKILEAAQHSMMNGQVQEVIKW
jgi:hypothetical protein